MSKFPKVHLMTGYFEKDQIVSPLSLLPNSIIVAEDPSGIVNEVKKPVVLRSSSKGVINTLKGDGSLEVRQLFHAHKDRPVLIPPIDAVSFLSAAKGEGWADDLVEIVKKYKPSEAIKSSKLHVVKPSQLALPKDDPKTDEEKSYKTWHAAQKKPLHAYIVPKTRALIFVVNENVPVLESINSDALSPNGVSLYIDWKKFDGYYLGVVCGTNKNLSEGLYRIDIRLDESKLSESNWNSFVSSGLENGMPVYRLAEMVKFDIQNPAGEFDIINCDPVTVEEALIVQYPRFYSHLVKAAQEIQADKSGAKAQIGNKSREPAKGLMDYAKSLTVIKDKAQLAASLISTDLGTYVEDGKAYNGKKNISWSIAKALHSHLETTEDKKVKAVIDSVFATKDGIDAWKDFKDARTDYLKALNSEKGLTPLKEVLSEKYFKMPKNTAEDLEKHARSIAGRIGIPKAGLDLFGRAMVYVDFYNGARAISQTGYAYFASTLPNLNKSKQEYLRIADDYFTILNAKTVEESIQLRGLFDLNESVLKEEVKAELNIHLSKILKGLEDDPDRRVVVAGHTCDIGSYSYNKTLSEKRAKAVERYLVNGGVTAGKISSQGYAYGQPVAPNDSDENRALNRRVEINAYTVMRTDTYPSREGMGSLERFRNVTVQNTLEKNQKELEMASQATDIALGVLAVVPATAPIAAGIALAKAGVSGVISLGAALDECVMGNVVAHYISDVKRQMKLTKESKANQNLLIEHCKNKRFKTNIAHHELWAAHFRLRAEAIAGLVGLLMRASIGSSNSPGDTYKDRLKKYHVTAYIENFLLNDQWLYPLNDLNILRMDTYWLFAINDVARNYDKLGFDEKQLSFGLDDQAKLTPGKVRETLKDKAIDRLKEAEPLTPSYAGGYGGGYMMAYAPQKNIHDHLTSEYQSYFPIHHLATESFESFCENFDPALSQYNESNYIHAAIYFRDPKDPNAEWELYSDTKYRVRSGRTYVNRYKKITPQHHIRVIVVFDDKMANIAPLSFQVNRIDGLDVKGPVYKELAKSLNEDELLEHEKQHFTGKIGCVFYPFYQFWDKTYLGLKPLSSTTKMLWYSDSKSYYEGGELDNMRYQITCIVGDNEDSKIEIPLGSKEFDASAGELKISKFNRPVPDEIKVGLNIHEAPEQQHMLNKDFLVSTGSEFSYPEMFKGDKDVRLLLRINNSMPFFGPRGHSFPSLYKEEEKEIENAYNSYYVKLESNEITVDRFNWYSPVSFAFLASCTELSLEDYKKAKKNWNRCINFHVDMFEDADTFSWDSDTKGPQLGGALIYLGKLTREVPRRSIPRVQTYPIKFDETDSALTFAPELQPIVDVLRSGDDRARSYVAWDIPKNNMEKTRYIFASVYDFEYRNPKGKKVKGLRPFGKGILGDDDDYFEFYLKDFKTSGTSGLNVGSVDGAGDGKLTLKFHTPPSLNSGEPWCDPLSEDELKPLIGRLKDEEMEALRKPGLTKEELKRFFEDEASNMDYSRLSALKN